MQDEPQGSPPRVRGKVWRSPAAPGTQGITPACAGKRRPVPSPRSTRQDHPRVCGEKSGLMRSNATGTGSPPRVRGKDVSGADATPWIRITPACAGKSFTSMKCFRAIQDHPRVCGEKTEIAYVVFLSEGSPPRVRGKVVVPWNSCVFAGITPACAGKRLKRSHSIGHFSCILCLFHSVLHRASVSGGSRAGPCAPPCLPAQNAVPV